VTQPPALPPELPADLRDFIECRSETVTIANGPMTWVRLPEAASGFMGRDSGPVLTIRPGGTPGTADLSVKLGFLSASLPAAVVAGKLVIETSKLPFWAPGSVRADITAFVDNLNAWLAANGYALATPTFDAGGMTLTKVPVAASA
jgi:hypothetical protein